MRIYPGNGVLASICHFCGKLYAQLVRAGPPKSDKDIFELFVGKTKCCAFFLSEPNTAERVRPCMAGRALGFGWGRALAAYVAEASSSNSPRIGFTRPRLGAVLLTGVRHGGFYPNDPWYPRASEPNSPSESIRPRESKPERELDKLNRQDHMGASQTRPESKGSSSTDPMDEACEALTRWWARETSSGRDDPPPLSSRRASVLVPLSRGPDGRVQVLLCTRAASLSTHAGEVCLPGGKNDPNEGDVEAATREASEEVGLRRTDARVLASLPPFLSKGHVSVRPVVAVVPDTFTPRPNPDEVDQCFHVPLETFLSTDGYSFADWEFTRGKRIRVHRFQRGGHDVWGLTAVMLVRVAEIVYGRRANFAMSPPGPGGTDIQRIVSKEHPSANMEPPRSMM